MMKITSYLILFFILVTVLFFALPELAMSQPPPPPPSKPMQNPIDGGLAILAAAGGAYAYKKLRDKKE